MFIEELQVIKIPAESKTPMCNQDYIFKVNELKICYNPKSSHHVRCESYFGIQEKEEATARYRQYHGLYSRGQVSAYI